MNHAASRIKLLLCLALAGCSSAPVGGPAPASFERTTTDLAEVTADAALLARTLEPGRVLLVLDIDNTLLAMEQGLGSDQWYEWQKQLAETDPCDARLAGDRLRVQGALYFASAMRPTQANAASLVREVQQAGIPTLALTSRGPDFRLQTFRELRRNGISFVFSAPGPRGGYPENFLPQSGTRAVRYEDGVFLTAGQHKGRMLADLLELTGSDLPAVIVVADDKQDNLYALSETFAGLGVPVRAWRYAGEDEAVADFDPVQAHVLWNELEPSLHRLQDLLGADHYDLSADPRTGCPAAAGQ